MTASVAFSGNATLGMGGQGEFLRQMVNALELFPKATVYSRGATAHHARCINVPFQGGPQRWEQFLKKIPILRGRQDWRNLISDRQFDQRVAAQVGTPDVIDGVSAQCHDTFHRLKRSKTRRVLTSLNTHIHNLVHTLDQEHQRLGIAEPHRFHPAMRRRALEEIEWADRIRVNSRWAKETFVENGVPADKITVIHPAIDHAHFYPVAKKDKVFRVLAISSIEPRKGIYYLLQAFEEAHIPNSELWLIGGTGDRWSKRMLEGFLTRNKNIRAGVVDVMAAPVEESVGKASVLVHPALEDGYALVVPQALASGRPVIATRQTGAAELIQEGENGFVVESRSIKELKDRLLALAGDAALLERMGHAAAHSVRHLNDAQFSQHVQDFYQEVLC